MIYSVEYQYEDGKVWVRGGLYKIAPESQRVQCCRMKARLDDAEDVKRLIYLSSKLGVPIRWHSDAEPQMVSILVRAAKE